MVDDDVIDLSEYEHPGGMEILQPFFGGVQDAYQEFEDNDHTGQARKIMASMKIGVVKKDISGDDAVGEVLND